MNRKINRRTRRMATQVIDFNPNDIHDIKTLETATGKACKTDQNQFNSQISKLLKQHETEGTENKEAVNCRSNNVVKEEQKHETKKQEQVNNKDLNDVNKSPKAISDGVLKLKEDKVVSEQLGEDNANKRKDVIQLNTNEKEKVKNNAISDGVFKLKEDKVVSERLCVNNANKRKDVVQLNTNKKEKVKNNAISDGVLRLKTDKVVSERLCVDNANKRKDVVQLNTNEKEKVKNNAISVDQIPLTTAIGVEQRQFVFKDLLNKFKKIENESLKSNIFEKKPRLELINQDPNENIEFEGRPVNVNQPITFITNEDSTFSLRRPVDIVERAFDFKKLISIFNK